MSLPPISKTKEAVSKDHAKSMETVYISDSTPIEIAHAWDAERRSTKMELNG